MALAYLSLRGRRKKGKGGEGEEEVEKRESGGKEARRTLEY